MQEYDRFHSTHLSVIQLARQGDRNDLASLFRQYAPPLRAHLKFRKDVPEIEVDDLLQDFFAKKMLAGKLLTSFDPRRGRFRTYMCSSLDHFCSDFFRKRRIITQPLNELDPPDSTSSTSSTLPTHGWFCCKLSRMCGWNALVADRNNTGKCSRNVFWFPSAPVLRRESTPSWQRNSGFAP